MIFMDDLAKYTGWIVAVFTSAWGVWQYFQNRKSEKELKEQKRHADFPIFCLCQDTINQFFELGENGILFVYDYTSSKILNIHNKDVGADFPAGESVILVLNEMDVPSVITSLKIGGETTTTHKEPDIHSSCQRHYWKYPFNPAMHGKRMEIKISMKSRSGVSDTHTYETLHGLWSLRRVDPSL